VKVWIPSTAVAAAANRSRTIQKTAAPRAAPERADRSSFYDPDLEEGCAFEELISFHGGLGGPQTRPFILAPPALELPAEPLIGAEAVHGLLMHWRRRLNGAPGQRSRSASTESSSAP
jgi:hypothetical protein